MTREEVIEWFRESPFYHKDHEPFNMAIEALEQEPCEDAISRQAASNAVCDSECHINQRDCGLYSGRCFTVWRLEKIPSVNLQEPKTGHWINVNEGKWNTIPAYKCSACGANADLRDWSGESPFCPWCGAKMEEQA